MKKLLILPVADADQSSHTDHPVPALHACKVKCSSLLWAVFSLFTQVFQADGPLNVHLVHYKRGKR